MLCNLKHYINVIAIKISNINLKFIMGGLFSEQTVGALIEGGRNNYEEYSI